MLVIQVQQPMAIASVNMELLLIFLWVLFLVRRTTGGLTGKQARFCSLTPELSNWPLLAGGNTPEEKPTKKKKEKKIKIKNSIPRRFQSVHLSLSQADRCLDTAVRC